MKWKLKSNSLNVYARLLKVSKPYWWMLIIGVLGTMALSGADSLLTWLIQPLVNKGLVDRDVHFIHTLPLILVGIFLCRGIAGFSSNYFISRAQANVVRDMRCDIFSKMLKLPASFYDSHNSGIMLSLLLYNITQVSSAGSNTLIYAIRDVSLVIGLLVVMFLADWKLLTVFVFIMPLIYVVAKYCSFRMRGLSKSVQDSMADITRVADEGIRYFKIIRIFGGSKHESKKFNREANKNRHRSLKIVVTNSVGSASVQMLLAIPLAGVIFIATLPSMNITAGSFGVVMAGMLSIIRPIRRLTSMNNEIQQGLAAADSVFGIMDEHEEIDQGEYQSDRVKGLVEYKQVGFQYQQSDKAVLRDINFTIQPGQTYALVGKSGSGKTTIINLLSRLYEVGEGEITIDGVPINDYRLANLREQLALVSQQTMLFDDTMANNIAYGVHESVSREDILKVAEAAYAMEFIEKLPEGIDTLVGENGVLLSGGQCQRIAIARALLKNAPILILDEATSALDTHSERSFQLALDELMRDRTTLVIAHRLSTIQNADMILVLDDGAIIERGTHEGLLAQGGAYSELYYMQFDKQGQSAHAE